MYYEIFDALCKEKNVRPADVSKETGISKATLSAWKSGEYTPKADKLQKIADYFCVSLDTLMGREQEKNDIAEIWIDPIEYDYRALPPGAAQIRKVLYEKAMGKAVGETAAEKLKLSLAKKMMELESMKEEKKKAETEQLVEYFNQLPDSLREVFLNFVKSTAEEYANKT